MLRNILVYSLLVFSSNAALSNDNSCLGVSIEGLDYPIAREQLIQSGWLPVFQTPPFADAPFTEWVQIRNYSEVESCAGTGVAPCRFLFKSSKDATVTLNVFTVGEVLGSVSSYTCNKAI